MTNDNTDRNATAFTVSIDVLAGTTTGASAGDRAATARALADASVPASAFSRPGHLFPLVAKEGGVLERNGHTEASVDLCRLAGLVPAAVIGELMHRDGSMMRAESCIMFARTFDLPIITIADLQEYIRSMYTPYLEAVNSRQIFSSPKVGSLHQQIDITSHHYISHEKSISKPSELTERTASTSNAVPTKRNPFHEPTYGKMHISISFKSIIR